MISEALEMYVEGGQFCHSWCMCVVGHGKSWFGWGRDGGGRWYACGTKSGGVGRMLEDAECEVIH